VEINSETVLLLRSIHQVNLAKEYGSLSQGKPFPQKSKLVSLSPYSAPIGYFAWVEGFRTQTWTTIRGIRYCCTTIIQSPRRSSFIIMRNNCMEDRRRCSPHYGKGTGRLEWIIVGHSIIRQWPEIRHPTSAISPSLSALPRRLLICKWSRILRRILSWQR